MASKSTALKHRATPGSHYFELVREFPLISIGSDKQLDEAISRLNDLLARNSTDADENQYIDTLSDLIENYERNNIIFDEPSPDRMLRHLLTAQGITQQELANHTGIAKSTISEVLSGKRPISLQMIKKLATFFNISPSLFVEK
ncbi:helix-turn-helix domain-containing protein [Lacunimicrobium album]